MRRRELLHIAPHHLEEEDFAQSGKHVGIARPTAERLRDGVAHRRLQPVARLNRQHRRWLALSIALPVIALALAGMDHDQFGQRADERIEPLVAVEKATDELCRLAQTSADDAC